SAAQLGQRFQDGQVAVGFHRETKCMRECAKPFVEFLVSGFNRGAAIEVKRAAKPFRSTCEPNILAKYGFTSSGFLFSPLKKRREFSRINVGKRLARRRGLRAHRTFSTTRVRSSESGALCANQSTSRKIMSESSVAESS